MAKLRKRWFSLLAIPLLCACILILPGSKPAEVNAEVTVEPPNLVITIYNCAVTYEWRLRKSGQILYWGTEYNLTPYEGNQKEIVLPYDGDRYCKPARTAAKAYDPVNKVFSSLVTTEYEVKLSQNETIILYGEYCKYSMIAQFNRQLFAESFPTAFDQNSGTARTNVWNHTGSNGRVIRGTIGYNQEVKDIDVSIPWIGYRYSDEVEVGGVRFQLRTGPSRVSIRALDNANAAGVYFAFGLE